eukprot:3935828-Rhodomonas_salina.7
MLHVLTWLARVAGQQVKELAEKILEGFVLGERQAGAPGAVPAFVGGVLCSALQKRLPRKQDAHCAEHQTRSCDVCVCVCGRDERGGGEAEGGAGDAVQGGALLAGHLLRPDGPQAGVPQ